MPVTLWTIRNEPDIAGPSRLAELAKVIIHLSTLLFLTHLLYHSGQESQSIPLETRGRTPRMAGDTFNNSHGDQ